MICDRCGIVKSAFTMSRFNTDEICLQCEDDEQEAPGYAAAKAEEEREFRAGNNNFRGVGLSATDRDFLAKRRAAR